MWAVTTASGKVLAVYGTRARAMRVALRKGQRKGREYKAVPFNG